MIKLPLLSARTPLAVAALSAAVLGLLAFAITDSQRASGYGTVRAVAATPAAPEPQTLAARLDALAAEAQISSNQQPAWRAFSSSLLELQDRTTAYEKRAAISGEVMPEAQERAMHALMFGAALSAIDEALSPDQAATVHRAVEGLMPTLICRSLAQI